jgi:hypothetical protein
MFTNLDFIHTRICYGFLNESNHQEYSVLFVIVRSFICGKCKFGILLKYKVVKRGVNGKGDSMVKALTFRNEAS